MSLLSGLASGTMASPEASLAEVSEMSVWPCASCKPKPVRIRRASAS